MANYINESELPEDTKLAFLGIDNKSDHKTFEVFLNIMIPLELKSFSNYNKAINWLTRVYGQYVTPIDYLIIWVI